MLTDLINFKIKIKVMLEIQNKFLNIQVLIKLNSKINNISDRVAKFHKEFTIRITMTWNLYSKTLSVKHHFITNNNPKLDVLLIELYL